MSQNQQFLQDFQNSMDRLAGMNQKIQDSLKQKQQFSDKLVNKLKEINAKIQALAGQINQLKANLDKLKGEVNNNTSAIGDKDKQIADLTQRINALEGEKQQLAQQLADFQKKTNDEKVALQQKIDNDEAQIRKLTEDNVALKNQSDALTKELANQGDLQGQHAEQLKKQTEQFQEQLAQQEQANKQQIDALMAKIKESDDKVLDLQKQLQVKTDEAAAHAKTIEDSQSQGQTQIAQLNKQIQDLKTENDDLIERIKSATVAISQAIENLETLANSVPNQQTEQYIDKLFEEIEQSIQNISGVLQGRQSQQGQPQQGQPKGNQISPNETVTLSQVGGPEVQVQVQTILDELNKKIRQNAGQKYIDALKAMQQPGVTAKDIPNILSNNNIAYKNNQIMGGKSKSKKTKKVRKQRGGFTYKANVRRRSISSKASKSTR
jgi:chromosome segregation ATPase